MMTKRFTLCRGTILAACSMAMFFAAAGPQDASAQSATDGQTAAQQSGAALSRIPARVTQKVDDQNVIPLHGGVHRMARSEFDRGAVPDSQLANHMILTLKRSKDQDAALRQLLVDQQDKSSKNYHAWLTPDQFGKQFGPADSDVQAVTDWLTSRGFSDIKVSPGRTRVEFSGNIGQVRNAFHTEVHHFMVRGNMHMAATSDVQVPAALAPVVAGVVSLHDFRPKAHAHKLGTFRRNKETGEVKPLFTYTGCGDPQNPQPCYAVGPGDFAKIYNVPATISGVAAGTGATIGIVQDSNLNVADVKAYRTLFGLPDNFSASNIVLNGPDPGIQGPDSVTDDEIEADLDVQIAGGVAPAANIQLVVSADSLSIGVGGVDLSAIYIIDNNSADILSESFGACEPNITASGEAFYNDLWQQAAAQGITVVLSSGDSGSDSCDQGADAATTGISVSGLASTEFNVAVGGTDFLNGAIPSPFWNVAGTATTSALSYIPETTWNNSCASTAIVGTLTTCSAGPDPNGNDLVAAGGGPSAINAKPIWQTGTPGNPADSFRDIPDISLFAGNGLHGSFYIICQTDQNAAFGGDPNSCDLNSPFQNFQGVGGTSAGAPAFAGIMALVKQRTGNRVGNANFVLYKMFKANAAGTICASSATPAATCIFYDTPATPVGTTGANISVACQGGTPNCSTATAGQTGVLVDPAHTNTPAWVTTANYDLATGLGSINVDNLVKTWPSITFTASTVSISSTSPAAPISIHHGDSVTFNIGVTPTTATGSVALIAQPSTGTPTNTNPDLGIGPGPFSQDASTALTGGAATITTNLLPGGTNYHVIARYDGDGTVSAGKSSPVTVTVAPENSFTVVSLIDGNGNPQTTIPYGSPYILQVAVHDSTHNLCSQVVVACPTGTITLKDNGAALNDFSGSNTAKLNSIGIAEDQPVQLSTGAHSLIATYSGDNSFNASTSAATAISITKATPSAITVAPVSVAANINVGLTATITTASSGVGPTGTVTFSSGTTMLGTAPVSGVTASGLNGSNPKPAFGTATLAAKFAASTTVTATYSGDSNYNAVGPSAPANVTVTTGTQGTTTALIASPTSANLGASVTLTATVTSTAATGSAPSNTVQFFVGSNPLGAPVTCASGGTTPPKCTASLATTSLPTGSDSVTAQYNGDANYASSTSTAVTVTINGTNTTTTVVPSATTITSGGSITFTATVTGATAASLPPGGTIQFKNGTATLGSAVNCVAASATSCTASLTTTLATLPPSIVRGPRNTPNVPLRPLYLLTAALFLAYLLTLRMAPPAKRLRYAYLGVVLFACATIGIAGCGGGGSGGGGGVPPHSDSISAVYSGDALYNGSTSAAVSISIH